ALSGGPAHIEAAGPRRRICPRIVNGDLVLDRVEIRACEFFDRVELFGRRHAEVIDPNTLAETDGIDNECVAFPMADGVSAVARCQVRGMGAAVHVNGAEAVRASGFENVEPLMLAII